MQPHFSDPEKPALLDMQKLRMDQCWRKGEIGNVTYLRILMQQGYAPRGAQTELNLLKQEQTPNFEARRLQASRAWMEDRPPDVEAARLERSRQQSDDFEDWRVEREGRDE